VTGECWTANGSFFEWYKRCLVLTTLSNPAVGTRGVFQELTARNRGGPIRGITWDVPNCVCLATTCPAIVSVTGIDGHGRGGILSVTSTGVDVLAPGFGYISSSEVEASVGNCRGRVITARVLIQPIRIDDFDIETSGLELVNVTSFTARFGGGHLYRSSLTRSTMSSILYVLVVFMSILTFLAVLFHIVMIIYRSKLEQRIMTKLKQA